MTFYWIVTSIIIMLCALDISMKIWRPKRLAPPGGFLTKTLCISLVPAYVIFFLGKKFEKHFARIFYFFFDGKKIILTNGFIKKTQKTPPIELEKALSYKTDYERRNTK